VLPLVLYLANWHLVSALSKAVDILSNFHVHEAHACKLLEVVHDLYIDRDVLEADAHVLDD
jgi:hypothetical protein